MLISICTRTTTNTLIFSDTNMNKNVISSPCYIQQVPLFKTNKNLEIFSGFTVCPVIILSSENMLKNMEFMWKIH